MVYFMKLFQNNWINKKALGDKLVLDPTQKSKVK